MNKSVISSFISLSCGDAHGGAAGVRVSNLAQENSAPAPTTLCKSNEATMEFCFPLLHRCQLNVFFTKGVNYTSMVFRKKTSQKVFIHILAF